MGKLTLIGQDCSTLTLIGQDCSTLILIGQTKYLQPTNQSLDLRCKHFHYFFIAKIYFNKHFLFEMTKYLGTEAGMLRFNCMESILFKIIKYVDKLSQFLQGTICKKQKLLWKQIKTQRAVLMKKKIGQVKSYIESLYTLGSFADFLHPINYNWQQYTCICNTTSGFKMFSNVRSTLERSMQSLRAWNVNQNTTGQNKKASGELCTACAR